MTDALAPRWAEPVTAAYRAGRPLALLFDYDGTLTPIVRHPSLAVLAARTRDTLAGLARLPEVAVGVLSGRALADLKGRVALPLPYFAGSAGLELELAGDRRAYPGGPALQATYTAMHERLSEPLRKHPGTWVERKPLALSVHFRELPPSNAADFCAAAAAVLADFPEVRGREVSQAIEVTPTGGWTKGTAVEAVLAHLRAVEDTHPLAVYFGDAPNDEEGMAAARAAGGLAVGIGPDPPAVAGVRVADTDEFTRGLEQLLRELKRARRREALAATPAG